VPFSPEVYSLKSALVLKILLKNHARFYLLQPIDYSLFRSSLMISGFDRLIPGVLNLIASLSQAILHYCSEQ
jgi:hypothetical protein